MRKLAGTAAVAVVVLAVAGLATAAIVRTFAADLDGAQEVPARATLGQGEATFKLANHGTELRYKLSVAHIENVIASHIHVAPVGVNGPIVAFLYGPVAPGGGPIVGKIAEGTITAANLVGPLAGHPLSDLVAEIERGNTYVNVHTDDGHNGPNTGAGDFPGGEIRGQIR
jgi:CHRD domain-containing protein